MSVQYILRTTACCVALACQYAHAVNEDLFPALSQYDNEAIRLHGLAQLYPGRVLFENPHLTATNGSRHATRVEDLPRNITYIRVYRLDEAKPVLQEHKNTPALILDFRYLKSNLAAVDILNAFAQAPWQDGLTTVGTTPGALIQPTENAFTQRSTPIIVLCNKETAGPFEAVLDKLQQSGDIIAVGESTAGHTGFYEKAAHQAWVLNGELRPSPEESLVGVGFQPRIEVNADTEESYISYHLYEAGSEITQLLRQDKRLVKKNDDPHTSPQEATSIQLDQVLQRGVDIVAALQILQQADAQP